ncbi:MAG: hypothetical protein LAO78_18415 [Acidobacteriia bacterium]|nr:hypothetical protein [Terriglobia bacterium]
MAQKILLAAMLTAVLSASAMSARQLGTGTHAVLACGSACTNLDTCKKPCFCFGLFNGNTTGVCQPEGPAPAPPK